MNSTSNRLKYSNEDRISKFPDSVLTHILSFLSTKSAVRTCTLSKRWKTPSLSVPSLDLQDFDSLSDYLFGVSSQQKLNFATFVDRVFSLRGHDMNLERFSLKCYGDYSPDRVDEWIRYVVRHNVREMKLDLTSGELYNLVPDVYVCRSLEALRLDQDILVDVPEYVSFLRLKVLEFNDVQFSTCESVEKLLLNCPVLKKLVITNCKYIRGCCLRVCGSALKELSLYSYPPVYREVGLRIDTPALETLQIGEVTYEDILIEENLQSLTTAYIDITRKVTLRIVPSSVDFMSELLIKISHVKLLTISGNTIRAISRTICFPTFSNMTKLELTWCKLTLLPSILASSPNLERLAFPTELVDLLSCGSHFKWSPSELVPECLSSHLKTVEIGFFEGSDRELLLVEYLLKHGKALREVSINCSHMLNDAMIPKKLLQLHRASKTCKLELFNNKIC